MNSLSYFFILFYLWFLLCYLLYVVDFFSWYFMSVVKEPTFADFYVRKKLYTGMGHNYYGEPAWPNDLLYMFPVVILGTLFCLVSLAVLETGSIGDASDPFKTPEEILPEWYFYPVFQILRTVPSKLIGILLMAGVPVGLATVPFC